MKKIDRATVGVAAEEIATSGTSETSQPISKETLEIVFERMLDQSLRLAENLETRLKNDESWGRKNDVKVQPYSTMLRNEIDQLRKLKENASGQNFGDEDMRRVVNTMGSMNDAPDQATKDVSIPERPTHNEKGGQRFRLIDQKLSSKDGEQVMKDLITKLSAYNNEVWLQSPNRKILAIKA